MQLYGPCKISRKIIPELRESAITLLVRIQSYEHLESCGCGRTDKRHWVVGGRTDYLGRDRSRYADADNGEVMSRPADDVTRNRIRLNAGRYSAGELARVMGMSVTAIEHMAARMGISLRRVSRVFRF